MKRFFCFVLLFITILFYACKHDDNFPLPIIEDNAYENVPKALWSYFQSFEEEAKARGLIIDLNSLNISAEIIEINDEGVAGSCSFGTYHPNHIVIDKTFWNQSSNLLKEMVVFHELGHCSLFRGHKEGSYIDGTCLSLMRSGLGDCKDNYKVSTREKYLNELFNGD